MLLQVLFKDLILEILKFLNPSELATVSLVNRTLRDLCNHDEVWKALCLKEYPTCSTTSSFSLPTWKDLYKLLTGENLKSFILL